MRFRDLKKQKKQPKDEFKPDVVYAGYVNKIKALITDMFMIYAPVLYIVAYVLMNGKDDFQSSQYAPLVAVTVYGLVYAILISKFGQTPGKKAYSLKVVDAKTYENISLFRALFRFIAFLFSATILFGLIMPFYREDKKALHDLLSGTLEIEVE